MVSERENRSPKQARVSFTEGAVWRFVPLQVASLWLFLLKGGASASVVIYILNNAVARGYILSSVSSTFVTSAHVFIAPVKPGLLSSKSSLRDDLNVHDRGASEERRSRLPSTGGEAYSDRLN
jgi:hypothetical protein